MTDADFRATAHSDAEDIKTGLAKLSKERAEDRSVLDSTKKVMNRVQVLMVAKLITLILLVFVIIGLAHTSHTAQQTNRTIQDCIVPTGTCAQRNAALQAQLVLSLSYQTQAQQLVTSLRVAQATGNNATIPVFQQRQQETADVLQKIKENVIEINAGRPPKHVIPTELPIATGVK